MENEKSKKVKGNVRNYTFTNCTTVTINEEGKSVDVALEKEKNTAMMLGSIGKITDTISDGIKLAIEEKNKRSAIIEQTNQSTSKRIPRPPKKRRPAPKKRSSKGKKK